MLKLEIVNHTEIGSPIIKKRILHSLKTKEVNTDANQSFFKLFGWIIDKKQQPINIIIVNQGVKVFHGLNVDQHSITLRMSKKLGFTIKENCGFSIKIEAIEDFDLYLEIDNQLIPWKKVKVITIPEPIALNQKTQIALQQFNTINFPLLQSGLANETRTDQNQINDSVSLAIDALFYFFSNQLKKITNQHLDAINHYSDSIYSHWLEVKKITVAEANEQPTFKGNIKLLLEECRVANFAFNLVEKIIANDLSLASPYSSNKAHCQESYEVSGGFNCLRFIDGEHCFFLMQGLTSADGLYFPSENILVSFAAVSETHVQNLKKAILGNFVSILQYAQADNEFFGIIASHSRPYHFYYDIWPVLVELSEKTEITTYLPNVIMRLGNDFYHTDSILDSPCLVLDSTEINALALGQHKFFVHMGIRLALQNRSFYDQVDSHLVNLAINSPSQSDIEKIKHLEGCYPIVWIGVEGQKRCWLEQIEGSAYILNQLHNQYSSLGIVFDGWTMPITPSSNDQKQAGTDQQIVTKIVSQLNPKIKFVSVVGETSHTKLNVGNKIDFFICNFSTGSMHVSRLLGKPGFGHLSNRYSEIALRHAMQIHPNNNVYLLPHDYIVDEDKDIGHDWISYSIDKKIFYRFITSKLATVLSNTIDPSIKIFIEPSYSVNPELRQYLKMATHGNIIEVFPGKKSPTKIEDIANYRKTYLQRNIIYDAFAYRSHKQIFGSANYMIWLRNPLQRLYYHAMRLTKNTGDNKADADGILKTLNAGHKSLDNYLTRMVSNDDMPFGKCTEAMLDNAIDILKNEFMFIGFDERQSESFDLLCATMDWDRSLFPKEIPNKFTVDEYNFTEDVLRNAEIMVAYDVRLYQAAMAIFEDKLIQSSSTINQFSATPLLPTERKKWWTDFLK
jgi:hypothetical protein